MLYLSIMAPNKKKKTLTPEHRANISKARKKMWADPEFKARVSKKMSEAVKKAWADPEVKARRLVKMAQAMLATYSDANYGGTQDIQAQFDAATPCDICGCKLFHKEACPRH